MSKKFKGKYIVIWPSNIDSTKSRRKGRKIPLKNAVKSPKKEELIEVARELGILVNFEEDKKYPKNWFFETGRLIVRKTQSKTETLKKIARKIAEIRAKRKKSY